MCLLGNVVEWYAEFDFNGRSPSVGVSQASPHLGISTRCFLPWWRMTGRWVVVVVHLFSLGSLACSSLVSSPPIRGKLANRLQSRFTSQWQKQLSLSKQTMRLLAWVGVTSWLGDWYASRFMMSSKRFKIWESRTGNWVRKQVQV